MSTDGPDLPIASPICAPAINRRQTGAAGGVLATAPTLAAARMATHRAASSYHHLINVAQWHISDDDYCHRRTAIINVHHDTQWPPIRDDGTTSSSDGPQLFHAGGRADPAARSTPSVEEIDPGAVIYTHVPADTDHSHEGDIRENKCSAMVKNCVTSRTGPTCASPNTTLPARQDHVFGLCHLLGYRFAPGQGPEGPQALHS